MAPVDLDDLVRVSGWFGDDHSGCADALTKITNEFKFNIASFHHAHEAYLVPEVLKKTLVHNPDGMVFAAKELLICIDMVEYRPSLSLPCMEGSSQSISASFRNFLYQGRFKREAYRGSSFAARVLADNGIPVVMKVKIF